MTEFRYRCALIIGAGPGISASLARLLRRIGVEVGVAARNIEKLHSLVTEIGAHAFRVDAASPQSVADLFRSASGLIGEIDLVRRRRRTGADRQVRDCTLETSEVT